VDFLQYKHYHSSYSAMTKKTFQDPFVKLFGSVARVRLLRLFLFSPKKVFSSSDIIGRTRVSDKDARRELHNLEDGGFIRKLNGTRTRYSMNEKFPFIVEFQQMLLSAPLHGSDVHARMKGAGTIKLIVLAGIFAGNFDGGFDMLIVGDRINERKLKTAMKNLEADVGTEIKYASLATPDFQYRMTVSDRFVRDVFDYPHRIVLDKLDIGLQ